MKKINVGFDIELETLIKSRMLIQANSGGGKSYLIRKLIEEIHGKVPFIVLDLEGEDLRNHLFAQLERLGDEDLSSEKLKDEVTRAKAISEVAKVVVESAKAEIQFMKVLGKGNDSGTGFIPIDLQQKNKEEKVKKFLKGE